MVTSIELSRAVAHARADSTAVVADEYTVLGVLASLAEVPLHDDVRATASALDPVESRTLDAIHLASALALGDELAGLVAYDNRMRRTALANGISVLAREPTSAPGDDRLETNDEPPEEVREG